MIPQRKVRAAIKGFISKTEAVIFRVFTVG